MYVTVSTSNKTTYRISKGKVCSNVPSTDTIHWTASCWTVVPRAQHHTQALVSVFISD